MDRGVWKMEEKHKETNCVGESVENKRVGMLFTEKDWREKNGHAIVRKLQ